MSLFRGVSYILLGDQVVRDYPDGFDFFGQGYVYWVFSFELVRCLLCFGVLLVIASNGRLGVIPTRLVTIQWRSYYSVLRWISIV